MSCAASPAPRRSPRASASAARRNAYVAEQWSSFLPVVRQIREFRPEVVFYSDANLGFLLYWLRRWVGVPYRLLFSNGGPCRPPFVRLDFVHQVNPVCLEEALRAGEPPEKHIMVPYGLRVGAPPCSVDDGSRRALRARLALPAERPVVLSVGWISRAHKRMDYVVEEVAKLPAPRPFLMLLGSMDRSSDEIIRLAHERLGPDGVAARSVPYDEVAQYYAAADCFVLASLCEGFGRVFLEALAHGLPVIAHEHPVMRYVLGEHGILADLSVEGALARHLREVLARPADGHAMRQRWESGAAPLRLGQPGAGVSAHVRARGARSARRIFGREERLRPAFGRCLIVQGSHLTSVLAGSAGTDPIRVISMADADGAVALAFHRFGPYHRARLQAVRTRLDSRPISRVFER